MRKTKKNMQLQQPQPDRKKTGAMVLLLLLAALLGVLYWLTRDKEPTAPKPQAEITILGEAEVPPGKMAAYIRRRNPEAKLNCSIEALVGFYYAEAGAEGLRADLALCQAIKETGCFAYGGDVVAAQNNYCGLGTTGGGVKGHFFATPQEGVRAHVQHLLAYTTTRPPRQTLVDPRYELLKEKRPEIFGQVTTWVGLNGKWAVPGKTYGQDILNMLDAVKTGK